VRDEVLDAQPAPVGNVDVAFYTVTEARHFLGVVGLANSLRLVGHDEPLFVTDAGLTAQQRQTLARVATVLPAPEGVRAELSKPAAPLLHPTDVMVVLDADVLVVRHLQPLIERALSGQLVFFENNVPDRFFAEWSDLGLGPPRKSAYVIAGHYLGPRALMMPMLENVDRLQRRLDTSTTYFGGGSMDQPYYFADQDLMNAYLMTTVDTDSITRLDGGFSPVPPFKGIRRRDGIHCVGPNGTEPFLLHHILRKPWLGPTRRNLYVDILRHVLWDKDAPITLDPSTLPLRLRPSRLAPLDLARASAQATASALVRGEFDVRGKSVRVSRRLSQRVTSR
jgi:hypothetical protein